jgi:hypothetical protein
MLIKKMTYTDYKGLVRTEEFMFNLNKAELMEMEMGTSGGMKEMLDRIVAEQDGKKIVEAFKDIVLRAYGQMSADGKYFDKSPEMANRFSHTEAYSDLFMELSTNAKAASDFINGILPQMPAEQPVSATGDQTAAMPVLASAA